MEVRSRGAGSGVGPATKAIILNTPNNPTGKVFTRSELQTIRDLRLHWDAFSISDEIYEHLLYDGAEHVSIATFDGMRERAITISALSKTYSVTGWRVGWAIAAPEVTAAIRKVHDFLTVGAAAPLQAAGAVALQLPRELLPRRSRAITPCGANACWEFSKRSGFRCFKPRGRLLHHDRYLRVRFSR